jgi:hypothetical protein
MGRHIGAFAAIDDRDLGTDPAGGTGGIDGDIAGADDAHLLADIRAAVAGDFFEK